MSSAPATYSNNITPSVIRNGVESMNNPKPTNLSQVELKEVLRKIHALRRVTKTTGFFTTHSIVELLNKLSADDLIAVGEELKLKPREMPRTSEVNQ